MINEIKISFKEPKYEVNKEKGTVKCCLRYEVLCPKSLQCIFLLKERTCLYVHGIAKVDEEDTFNENIGKKISLAKAEKKAYAKIRKHLIRQITTTVANAFDIGNNFIEKAYNVVDHNNKYLEQWQ